MNRLQLTTILIATGAAIGFGASAQDQGKPPNRGAHMLSMMDTDGDGAISSEEMAAHRTAMFAAIDADGNNALSLEEIIAHQEAMRARRKSERQARHFDRIDADSDGGISAEEFASAPMPRMGRLDQDGDGNISAEELADMQRRHGGHGPRHGGQ